MSDMVAVSTCISISMDQEMKTSLSYIQCCKSRVAAGCDLSGSGAEKPVPDQTFEKTPDPDPTLENNPDQDPIWFLPNKFLLHFWHKIQYKWNINIDITLVRWVTERRSNIQERHILLPTRIELRPEKDEYYFETIMKSHVCQRRLDPLYIVSYYSYWDKTSVTCNVMLIKRTLHGADVSSNFSLL